MTLRLRKRLAAAALLASVVLLSAPPALAQGCAMCRTAVEGQDDPLTRGLGHSVMFMVSMPFAVFFSAAGWLVLSSRKARNAARFAASAPDEPQATTDDPQATGGV
ncbi:MAG TPA: hypothetical protein VE404_07165 [Verrucomicrobiae bacterium]|nr:hypothetical protein [Verrucomicrobiae bacterium]